MALEVLDGLDASPAAPAALRALSDPDPEVRRAAVHALPPRATIDPERAPTVLAALGAALRRDADAEVRRRAALALGRWAVDADELGPVLTALARDRNFGRRPRRGRLRLRARRPGWPARPADAPALHGAGGARARARRGPRPRGPRPPRRAPQRAVARVAAECPPE